MNKRVDERRDDRFAFLAGGGEMGERTRTFDWTATPLGPVDGWPQSLKIAVRIMLDSRYAMWLGWGADFTFFYNDAYARMSLGSKHPWALGRPAREVWPEIWEDIGPRAESVIKTGQATWDARLLLFLEREGFPEETYHTFSYSPIPGDRGGVGGMLCVVTEDTERTIGERRLKILRELAARTTDEGKSVEEACQTASRILSDNPMDVPFALFYLLDSGGRRATLAGSTGLEVNTPAAPSTINLADDRESWPLATVAASGQGAVMPDLPQKFGPLPGGPWPEAAKQAVVLPMARPGQTQLAGFVVAGTSSRRPLDDAYRGFLELLAGQVATAIANARAYDDERKRAEALAEIDRAKTTFFSNVSHEFRTPLTLMLGPLEDALAEGGHLPPQHRERLEIVRRNGLRLHKLVNTLLDFSRIEAGRVQATYEPTDLAAFTAELASNFRSACERAGLELKVECPPLDEPVFVDRQMWENVVLNLLSNAFKFTMEGQIAVSIHRAGPAAQLVVSDTGTGIPANEMPKLFERFHRVEGTRGRTHEGSGIGLALVQELVRLHGGSIHAESELGKGTSFTVSLPLGTAHLPAERIETGQSLAPATPGATPFVEEAMRWLPDAQDCSGTAPEMPRDIVASVPALTASPDERPRILVADDNADMRQYTVRLLAGQYRVEAVPDGMAALAAVRESAPDLILSDVMMPRLDGFALLKELRADSNNASIPVILLSARAGEESKVEGMRAGADDYVVKPFNARELLARVGALLQITRLRRESEQAIRRRSDQLRRLAEVATRLNTNLDISSITGIVTEEARALIRAHQAVTGFTIDQNWAQAIHSVSLSDKYAQWRGYDIRPDGSGIYSLVCRVNRPMRLTQPEVEAHAGYKWFGSYAADHPPLRGWLAAPLVGRDGRNIGLVQLSDKVDGDFTEEDEAILVQLAQMASVAVENAHLVRELREGDHRKDEFLAILAHELRNPLAPIRNGLEILRLANGDFEAGERARTMMERQVGHLVHLVDDLLDLSRISRGKIELRKERVELTNVIQQAVETSRPLIDANRHELTIDLPASPVYVDADITRLAQVFSNLLNNAAKYTERGGNIRLAAQSQDQSVLVSVKDSGIGIPANMLPKVFDIFTQVDRNLERSEGGLGIGLSIVKRLVMMHDGTVLAKSDGHGMGSEFIVQLPVVPPAAQRQTGAGVLNRLSNRTRILVVDDNRDAATSLAMMLNLKGNDAKTAHDGLEALKMAAAFRPELILLDIGMPRLNGYETARRIRAQPWGKSVVIVALTGWGQEEDRRKAEEAGFNSHMVKPVQPAALEKLLAGLQSDSA